MYDYIKWLKLLQFRSDNYSNGSNSLRRKRNSGQVDPPGENQAIDRDGKDYDEMNESFFIFYQGLWHTEPIPRLGIRSVRLSDGE